MSPVDTPLDILTFVLAWLGYASVTAAMLARYAGSARASKVAAPIMLGITTFHVFLVWAVRHGFDPGHLAVSGPDLVPIIVLYTLFTLIIIHGLGHARHELAGRAVYPAWVLVTLMGMPSAFAMPDLSWMRIPMGLTFLVAVGGVGQLRRHHRAEAVVS